jgi:hypothetical protein
MDERRFQVVVGILSVVPVLTGGLNLALGVAALNLLFNQSIGSNPVLDSEVRFLGAIWLMCGVVLFRIVPKLKEKSLIFRYIASGIFLGGVGRLVSVFAAGIPPTPFFGLIALELLGMPLLMLWESRIRTSVSTL